MKEVLTIADYKPYTLKELTKIFIDIRYLLDCHPELIESRDFTLKITNILESGKIVKKCFYININSYSLSVDVSNDCVQYSFDTSTATIYFKSVPNKDIVSYFQTAVSDLIEAADAANKYMFNKKLDELKITYQNE